MARPFSFNRARATTCLDVGNIFCSPPSVFHEFLTDPFLLSRECNFIRLDGGCQTCMKIVVTSPWSACWSDDPFRLRNLRLDEGAKTLRDVSVKAGGNSTVHPFRICLFVPH